MPNPATPAPPPVILLHGIGDTAAIFDTMAGGLTSSGRQILALDLTPNNGDAGLEQLAEQVGHAVHQRFGAQLPVDVVGFSMGGIVARYWVQRCGGLARTRKLITIASPHQGTFTGFLRNNPGARQLRPGSAFLRDLNHDADMLERCGFVSLWTPLDLMILPASSSVLPVGQSIPIRVAAHPWMLRDRRVLSLVDDLLNNPER